MHRMHHSDLPRCVRKAGYGREQNLHAAATDLHKQDSYSNKLLIRIPPPQLRQQRKVDLEKHVSETNRLMRLANGDIPSESESEPDSDSEDPLTGDAVFTGFDDPINESAEYIDEDKYTTVTVETVNINRVGFSRPGEEEAELRKEAALREEKEKEEKKKRVWTKERPKTDRPKKKKVKFRYETKAERKVERMKQGMKKKKLAEKRSKAKEESEKR